MCGIAGILNNNNPQLIEAMVDKISHRGPDNTTLANYKKASLGFCRLSIIDLSKDANQPLVDKKHKISMVFNGEIYNYLELRKELEKEFNFYTKSDSEVFLKSYIKWGTECFNKVNGMFAVCFYHYDNHKAILARDRFGQKPLFYRQDSNNLYFASEIKSLNLIKKPEPNKDTWIKYLATGVYDDSKETFFNKIFQINAGCYISFEENSLKETRYYDISKVKKNSNLEYEEAKDKIFHLVNDSVKIHTRADVPYCLSLSSGLDSSAILASLNNLKLKQNKLKCFTLDFEGSLSESVAAKKFSKNWSFEHHVNILDQKKSLSLLNEAIYHEESPLGGLLNLGQHFNFENIKKQNLKVCLDGAGVDEVFCGYKSLHQKFLNGNPEKRLVEEYSDFWGEKYNLSKFSRDKTAIDGTFSSNKELLISPFEEAQARQTDLLETQINYLTKRKLNRGLRMKDRYSMHHSIELRVPFIDHRLVELGLSLNPRFYFNKGRSKSIIRDSMSRIMTPETCFASKKSINAPQTEWLQNELWSNFTKKIINSESFNDRRLLDGKLVKEAHDRFLSKKQDNSFFVWQWINMELWHKAFID